MTTSWVGHAVVLFSDPSVMFGGKRVGGLRIRAVTSSVAVAPPPPERVVGEDDMDESVGF